MRDLYLDFGTFTVRIVETMPGEPDEILSEDTVPAESDFGVEIIDADKVPGLELHTVDRDRILLQELRARIEAVKAKLYARRGRLCKDCGESYYFEAEAMDYPFQHNGSLEHEVKPIADDAEDIVILAHLRDMEREVFARTPIS